MYTYKEQYEAFIGRKFYHKDDKDLLYTFGTINEDETVQVLNEDDEIPYGIEESLGYIRDNIWVVLD